MLCVTGIHSRLGLRAMFVKFKSSLKMEISEIVRNVNANWVNGIANELIDREGHWLFILTSVERRIWTLKQLPQIDFDSHISQDAGFVVPVYFFLSSSCLIIEWANERLMACERQMRMSQDKEGCDESASSMCFWEVNLNTWWFGYMVKRKTLIIMKYTQNSHSEGARTSTHRSARSLTRHWHRGETL